MFTQHLIKVNRLFLLMLVGYLSFLLSPILCFLREAEESNFEKWVKRNEKLRKNCLNRRNKFWLHNTKALRGRFFRLLNQNSLSKTFYVSCLGKGQKFEIRETIPGQRLLEIFNPWIFHLLQYLHPVQYLHLQGP